MATVQIRNLDDEAYEVLKVRAAASGRSLQQYLKRLLEEQASRPTLAEQLERLRTDMQWTEGEPALTMDEIVEVQREMRAAR